MNQIHSLLQVRRRNVTSHTIESAVSSVEIKPLVTEYGISILDSSLQGCGAASSG